MGSWGGERRSRSRKGWRGKTAAVKHQNTSPKELEITVVYALVAY